MHSFCFKLELVCDSVLFYSRFKALAIRYYDVVARSDFGIGIEPVKNKKTVQ